MTKQRTFTDDGKGASAPPKLAKQPSVSKSLTPAWRKAKPGDALIIRLENGYHSDLMIYAYMREYDEADDTLYIDSKDLTANGYIHGTSGYDIKIASSQTEGSDLAKSDPESK